MSEVTDWRSRAACQHTDPELFFPDCTAGPAIDRAKQICDGCPVRARCLDWALSHGAASGIWGGRTEAERFAMGTGKETRVCPGCHPGATQSCAGRT